MIQNEIRPFLESHQGDIRLVSWDREKRITIELRGDCADSSLSRQNISFLMEEKLKSNYPQIKQVVLKWRTNDSLIEQALQILRRSRTGDE